MNDTSQRKRFLRGLGLGVVAALLVCGTAVAQETQVSGKVTTPEGTPIPGVTVRVRGTNIATVTDAEGSYSVAAPANGIRHHGRRQQRRYRERVQTDVDQLVAAA
ncbi:MAG: hypothetical protein DMD48_04875 [Gemmatimonadetes bacterium]|nr:MAG: hypothetical protein DMD48_04875 [Gemmatimonadota bacterium]